MLDNQWRSCRDSCGPMTNEKASSLATYLHKLFYLNGKRLNFSIAIFFDADLCKYVLYFLNKGTYLKISFKFLCEIFMYVH